MTGEPENAVRTVLRSRESLTEDAIREILAWCGVFEQRGRSSWVSGMSAQSTDIRFSPK